MIKASDDGRRIIDVITSLLNQITSDQAKEILDEQNVKRIETNNGIWFLIKMP